MPEDFEADASDAWMRNTQRLHLRISIEGEAGAAKGGARIGEANVRDAQAHGRAAEVNGSAARATDPATQAQANAH